MALDPSIALQVKPLDFDPIKSTANALSLKQMLMGEKLNSAFVWDNDAAGNPVLNRAKTLQNMYTISPQQAMQYEQQLAMRDNWRDQSQARILNLATQQQNAQTKRLNAAANFIKSGLSDIYNEAMTDPRMSDPSKVEEAMSYYFNKQNDWLNNFQKQSGVNPSAIRQALPQDKFDLDAIYRASTSDDAVIPVAQGWARGASSIPMMDDEGNVNPQSNENSAFFEGAPQDSPEGFVQTTVPSARMTIQGKGGGLKPNANQQKAIRAAALLRQSQEAAAKGDQSSSDMLWNQGRWLQMYNKEWTPNETFKFDRKTGKLVFNDDLLRAKERIAKAGKTDVYVGGDRPNFKEEQALKKDFDNDSKTFLEVKKGFTAVRATLQPALERGNINAAETLSAATAFMKMLDPGSVVRESELTMALSATGWLDRLQNAYQTLKEGKVLTPAQVQNFWTLARQLYDAHEQNHALIENQYREDAKAYGLNPDRVVKNYRIDPKSLETKPAKQPAQQKPTGAIQGVTKPAPAKPTQGAKSAPKQSIPRIASDADYDKLPSGAQFYDPKGVLRRKP